MRDWVGTTSHLEDMEKRKFLTLLGLRFQLLAFQSVASHYSDCAILDLKHSNVEMQKMSIELN
jgi:hypothetical protein